MFQILKLSVVVFPVILLLAGLCDGAGNENGDVPLGKQVLIRLHSGYRYVGGEADDPLKRLMNVAAMRRYDWNAVKLCSDRVGNDFYFVVQEDPAKGNECSSRHPACASAL